MNRSKLKSLATKTRNPEDMVNYKPQQNLVVRLNKQAKKDFLKNITHKAKHFYVVKPNFSDKKCAVEKRIQLLENDVLYTDDENIAEIFNSYFNRITEHLDIQSWESQTPALNSVNFESHPSVNVIKEQISTRKFFEFSHVEEQDVLRVILNLNSSKAVSSGIPTCMLKTVAHFCIRSLTGFLDRQRQL